MAKLLHALGDSHNFGRRVARQNGRIYKPRTLFWERLLLSPQSPLRLLLTELGVRDGLGTDAFGFLPSLEFYDKPQGNIGGEVEELKLEPLLTVNAEQRRELCVTVGRSLALWSWLGAADLHWENLVLGVNAQGRILFGPLDVELLLADLAMPTETKLLPDADPEYAELCRHAAGVRRVLPYLGKPIVVGDLLVIAASYRRTLRFLDRHARAIADLFLALPGLADAPIRVLLRSTGEYAQNPKNLWPPLLAAETEQLARGDVPYFFRLYGKKGIHYYANEMLTELGRLPLRGDVPQLEPLLDLTKGFKSPLRQKLRQDGFFTVLGAFDDASLRGTHETEEVSLTFSARTLQARFSDGEELSTSRKLRAFVGSVYLPCTCGETRSVFVPDVTVCQMH